MEAERLAHWRAADVLFDEWLDLAEDERGAWLAAVQAPEAVRHRLLRLVAAHLGATNPPAPPRDALSGRRLGDWTLEDEIGRGGMAIVYRARRDQGMASQQAALKILTLGALGNDGRERFRREAGILARLNHPNVTALVDSGIADDGTCWLAMPLVQGERIDRWCEAQALDARATVQLYLQVCAAVAYAHRNLVVHRDLKPSNVLVEPGGHVRLLDFGIGQFTDSADERTQTLWRALTPGYAAPEQLRGDAPSTAVDVYGLGALLHRLLTGRTPAIVGGNETTRPSQLVRQAGDAYHRHYVSLRSDLDRVLLKALAEEPEQRYASVEALAADLQRWLEGRPVLAQKPRPGYRLRKFVVRHRMGVAAGVVLAATLASGVGATLWQAAEARREAANARERAHRAETVRDFLGRMFITTRGTNGATPDALELLDASSRHARDEFSGDDPLAAADLLLLTGIVHYNLGTHDKSQADLEQALQLLQPHAARAASELARVHWELGRLRKFKGDIDGALDHYRQADAFNERSDAPLDDRMRVRISLGEMLLHRDRAAAQALFGEIVEQIRGSELEDTVRHLNALNGLSIALAGPGHDPLARLPVQEERLRITRLIYSADDGGYAHTLADVTHTYRSLGMFERAESLAREAVAAAERTRQRPQELRAMTRCALGAYLQQRGRMDEALEQYDLAYAALESSGSQAAAGARCLRGRAYVRAALGRHAAALEDLDRGDALARAGDANGSDPDGSCSLRATVLLRLAGPAAAAPALAACAPAAGAEPSLDYAVARAELLLAQGDRDAAMQLLAALRERYRPDGIWNHWMRPWMVSALMARQGGADPAALATALGDHAGDEPLATCLAAPTPETCLALP